MPYATNPELQIELEKVMGALRELGPDEILTYDELTHVLGYHPREKPWVLLRAKQRVEKEDGIRFASVRSVGPKRLATEDLPGIGQFARQRIGRIAKKDANRLTDLRGYNDIDRKTQTRIDAERSLLGAVSAVASTQGQAVATLTRTGPVVAARVFDYIRPERVDGAEQEVE